MILTINGGSSSIKFALFNDGKTLQEVMRGAVENIGKSNTTLHHKHAATAQAETIDIPAKNHEEAADQLILWLEKQNIDGAITAIGHRIVQGMQHQNPEKITAELLAELKRLRPYDPEHLPEEIRLIELLGKRFPDVLQVACFDTAFHATMPTVAKMMAIPRRYYEQGIHRYGFHGLSYAYLMQELERLEGPTAAKGKIVLAHLGSGASLAAVKGGKCLDTTMGFTPASGLAMSSRAGDIDPGIAWYLMAFEKLTANEFSHLTNHESGLLGVSETSGDMQELAQLAPADSRAAEAIELFCYQAKKWIGAYAAALGGIDILVFSGGIGEHDPQVRTKICTGLSFLGLELDEAKNARNEAIVSKETAKLRVRVMATNEELMIAQMLKEMG